MTAAEKPDVSAALGDFWPYFLGSNQNNDAQARLSTVVATQLPLFEFLFHLIQKRLLLLFGIRAEAVSRGD